MVITSLRDDAMRNLRLAANSDCGGIGFRLLAYDFLQRTLLAKRISIDVYGALPFSLATDGNWWYIDSSDSAFQAVVANINAMRAAGELPALSVSGSLCSIAQDRAWYQIENNTLTHDGASTPEILAQGQQSASEVCSVWQNSPSHYAVIMNPAHTQMGVGCWFEYNGKCVWCVTFS